MTTKPLLIALIFAMVGCSSAPKMPAQPREQTKAQETEPQVDSSGPLPLGFWQDRIVEAAKAEWVYFGQQIVVIDGDEESIPHVGIWEDDDDSHSDRINQYWRAVGKPRLSGYDCKQPWSAAFISWIMQAAGVPNDLFPPSRAHRSYLNRFVASADDPYAALIPRICGSNMAFPHTTPLAVFATIDAEAFGAAFRRWVSSIVGPGAGRESPSPCLRDRD